MQGVYESAQQNKHCALRLGRGARQLLAARAHNCLHIARRPLQRQRRMVITAHTSTSGIQGAGSQVVPGGRPLAHQAAHHRLLPSRLLGTSGGVRGLQQGGEAGQDVQAHVFLPLLEAPHQLGPAGRPGVGQQVGARLHHRHDHLHRRLAHLSQQRSTINHAHRNRHYLATLTQC